jgi:hypothetical protein
MHVTRTVRERKVFGHSRNPALRGGTTSDLDALFVLDAIEVRALGEEGEPQRCLIAVPRLNPIESNVSYVCVVVLRVFCTLRACSV